MKVYTEVNYKWEDGKLIETSSDSFEYSGDITLCGGGGGGNPIKKVLDTATDVTNDALAGSAGQIGKFAEGDLGVGKGSLGAAAGKLYGGSFKGMMDAAAGKTGDDGDVAAPDLSAEEVDAQGALVAQQKKRTKEMGRGAANLTAGQTATMLTS